MIFSYFIYFHLRIRKCIFGIIIYYLQFFRAVLLIGEMDKWVPHSRQRTREITLTSTQVKVILHGGVAEVINYTVFYPREVRYHTYVCTTGEYGQAWLSVPHGECVGY